MAKKVYVGAEKNNSKTLLLLHGESLEDNGTYGLTVSNTGVTVSTAKSKFGGSSLYFNGSSYLEIVSDMFITGTSDLTIDWWEYRTISGKGTSATFNVLTTTGFSNFLLAHAGTKFFGSVTSSAWGDVAGGVDAFIEKINQWSHKALVRKGNALYIFNDGVLTHQQSITASFTTGTGKLQIGRHSDDGGMDCLTGYIDEFRVSNVARWTSNFTPPTSAYTSEESTVGVAREAKKIYIGISDKARRIKKGYIGIGGVARPFMASAELTYYGKITDLNAASQQLAATSVGSYALFGGGRGSSSSSSLSRMTAYSESLTSTAIGDLSIARYHLAATNIGNYAVFGGGYNGSSYYSTVDAYNTSLTRSRPTTLSSGRYRLAATNIGNYAVFGGGYTSNGVTSGLDAYDANLARSNPNGLRTARECLVATSVGNYALFGGGLQGGTYYSTVDAFDTSLTRSAPSSLSNTKGYLAATSVGNYALFGGGYNGGYYTKIDAYDTNLTKTTTAELSIARRQLAATSIGGYALFGGGFDGSYYSVVDAYDTNLTRTAATALNTARSQFAATSIGNYALFGGGYSPVSSVVDAYTIV